MKFLHSFHSLIPYQASSLAPQVDDITFGLLVVCGGILTLVFGLIFIFCVVYRKGSTARREITWRGQTLLEFGWTGATLVLFLALFVWGSVPYMHMHIPPPGATVINVVAKQWMWKFQYPNGIREINTLHVPVGEPIILNMTSQDVIHSLFVPDFRMKQDVLPGRYTRTWFKATEPGEYHLFCTQYCGSKHADMEGKIVVMRASDYQLWLQTGLQRSGNRSMASRGMHLFTRLGCISCHEFNPGVRAPALQGVFGTPVRLSDGKTVIADENYIRESILNPSAKIVQGYPNIMPSFAGLISEEDVLDLIAYVKSLSGTPQTRAPQGVKP